MVHPTVGAGCCKVGLIVDRVRLEMNIVSYLGIFIIVFDTGCCIMDLIEK